MKPDTPNPPARILALAKQIGDEPIAWNERTDGSITIVFCNKGKLTFDSIPTDDDSIPADTHTQPVPSPAPRKKNQTPPNP